MDRMFYIDQLPTLFFSIGLLNLNLALLLDQLRLGYGDDRW